MNNELSEWTIKSSCNRVHQKPLRPLFVRATKNTFSRPLLHPGLLVLRTIVQGLDLGKNFSTVQANVVPLPVALDSERTEPSEEHEEEEDSNSHGSINEVVGGVFAAWKREPGSSGCTRSRANSCPFLVAADHGSLETVDELGERDILMVVEDVDSVEIALCTVPELEPQELTSVGWWSPAEFNSQSRTKVGDRSQFWVLLDNLGLMEERDEGLVCRLDQHELQGVSIESHALKGRDDGVKSRTACNVSDSTNVAVVEDGIFTVVGKTTDLLNESGWETMSISLVVNKLGRNVVVKVVSVGQRSGSSKDKVFESVEEGLRPLVQLLELRRG